MDKLPTASPSPGPVRVHYKTFGCKTNQHDTERMRQLLEERLPVAAPGPLETADLCVVNTCTVTARADADARRYIRRARRRRPEARIVVAGCSAALKADGYRAMPEVSAVVRGHDPGEVLAASARAVGGSPLLQPGSRLPLHRAHMEPVGAGVLRRRAGRTRSWLKVQDGCDRKCSFCATRLARGRSRSRPPDLVVAEARTLARAHPELVVTGVHIGHYGRDLAPRTTLAALVGRLLDEVPEPRFRLGSVEATEIDDDLLGLMAESRGRLAPHLHMPLQSGSDAVLGRMRRWHTRGDYLRRAREVVAEAGPVGLGADVITGFPGETAADHALTVSLVEELPFTYLHVFPYSARDDTAAASLSGAVAPGVARERGRELRSLAARKGLRYARRRGGEWAEVVLEGDGGTALTGDYLRVRIDSPDAPDPRRLHRGRLSPDGARVSIPGDGEQAPTACLA